MGLIGREGVILKGATAIGSVRNISLSIGADLIKDYVWGSEKPDTLASGNKSFKVTIEKAYIDSAYATDVLNGTPVTIEVRPQGTGAGKPKITISDVIFNTWDYEQAQDGIIGESISGEGKNIAFGTQ